MIPSWLAWLAASVLLVALLRLLGVPCLPRRDRHGRLRMPIRVRDSEDHNPGGIDIMVTMTATQQVELGPVTAVDRRGNAAPIDGAPEFASSDPTICTVEAHPSGDPTMALAKAVGPVGSVQITVSADADLGEGVKTIQGILQIDVLAAEASALTIPSGQPTEQDLG